MENTTIRKFPYKGNNTGAGGYKEDPVKQKSISRSVVVNNIFAGLTLEERIRLVDEPELLSKMFTLSDHVLDFLVKDIG